MLRHVTAFSILRTPTEAFGQQVLDKLGMVANVQDAVDAGVDQLLLLVQQILTDVLRHKHHVAFHVDHKEEAVQGLREQHHHPPKKDIEKLTH